MARIPLSIPVLSGNEWTYLKECLDTNWVSSVGPFVQKFEAEMVRRLGGGSATAVINGTGALHLTLLALGIGPGDAVLVSGLTFIAPANAISYTGALPIFVDAEKEYWQMDPASARRYLEENCDRAGGRVVDRRTGRTVKALLPVHLLGHPFDADEFASLCREYDLKLVEDAAEAIGARYKGRPVGTLGDAACFSFNGNKIITAGNGGVIASRDKALVERAHFLATQAKADPVEYFHDEVGYNYRLSNLHAALGFAQLELLDRYIEKKRAIASRYGSLFQSVPEVTLMREAPWAHSVFWLYTVLLPENFPLTPRQAVERLAAKEIESRPLWRPLHLNPSHAHCPRTPMGVAENLYARALSIPSSVNLGDEELEKVAAAVTALVKDG